MSKFFNINKKLRITPNDSISIDVGCIGGAKYEFLLPEYFVKKNRLSIRVYSGEKLIPLVIGVDGENIKRIEKEISDKFNIPLNKVSVSIRQKYETLEDYTPEGKFLKIKEYLNYNAEFVSIESSSGDFIMDNVALYKDIDGDITEYKSLKDGLSEEELIEIFEDAKIYHSCGKLLKVKA